MGGFSGVHEGHMTLLPPSMAMVWPQTNEASSDARKAMTLATSSTLPTRPSGWLLWPRARYPFTALPDIPARAKTSVPSMTPGLTLFTLMPDGKDRHISVHSFSVLFLFHFYRLPAAGQQEVRVVVLLLGTKLQKLY